MVQQSNRWPHLSVTAGSGYLTAAMGLMVGNEGEMHSAAGAAYNWIASTCSPVSAYAVLVGDCSVNRS